MKNSWLHNRDFLLENSQSLFGNVVDVGCGSAKYKKLILGLPKVTAYTGIDFYQTKNVDIVSDLNKELHVKEGSFDAAVCISVIEHLQEPQLALNEMFRILRPGACLLLSTPWIYPYHHEPDDYFRYSRYALKYMLEKSGFEVISILPTGGKTRVALVLTRLWFPWTARLVAYIERSIKRPEIHTAADEKRYLTTPSHHVVAKKPL